MTEDDLIAAILADRGERAAYRVYGDWLEQQGDPLGMLIALQLRNAETNLEDGALLVQEKTHFIRYPSLIPSLDQWRARYRWRWGLIDHAELEAPTADELRRLLEHRSCVLLRELILELDPSRVAEVLAALAQRIPTITTLALRAPPAPARTADPGLWARVPLVTQLELEGRRLFDDIEHAGIRVLTLEGAPSTGVWKLPALKRIAWKDPGPVRSLASLWKSELPSLRELTLRGEADADYADDHFFAAIERLEKLTVSADAFGVTPRQSLETLIAHAPRFAHLAELYVDWRYNYEEDEDEETAAELAALWHQLSVAVPALMEIDD